MSPQRSPKAKILNRVQGVHASSLALPLTQTKDGTISGLRVSAKKICPFSSLGLYSHDEFFSLEIHARRWKSSSPPMSRHGGSP